MSDTAQTSQIGPHVGRCLCGAVRIEAESLGRSISACHCEMCRRWGGGITMGIEAPEAGVRVSGPVETFASSHFAERAWCGRCGSALWLRNTGAEATGFYELVPGIFETAGGARLTREVYADRAAGFAFAGDIERVTAADYEAQNPHIPGGSTP